MGCFEFFESETAAAEVGFEFEVLISDWGDEVGAGVVEELADAGLLGVEVVEVYFLYFGGEGVDDVVEVIESYFCFGLGWKLYVCVFEAAEVAVVCDGVVAAVEGEADGGHEHGEAAFDFPDEAGGD